MPSSRRIAATFGDRVRSGSVSTPLGITATFPAGKLLVLDQETAVRRGHRDERIGDRRQHSVEPADAVGPARAVQGRDDDGHAQRAARPTGPKTFCRRRRR